MFKRFNVRHGIGKAKYVVNFHDGRKTHRDGSAFFDCKLFRNLRDLAAFVNQLRGDGYTEE